MGKEIVHGGNLALSHWDVLGLFTVFEASIPLSKFSVSSLPFNLSITMGQEVCG